MKIIRNLTPVHILFGFIFSIILTAFIPQDGKKISDNNGKVDNLRVLPVTLSRLDISWDAVPNASGYKIFRGSAKDFAADEGSLISISKNNFYANRELSPSTTYFYKVKALFANSEGALSSEVSGTTRHRDLALLINESQWTIEGDAFQITWDALKGGEITEIKQYDGAKWNLLNSEPSVNNLNTIPGYIIKDNSGTAFSLSECHNTGFQIIKATSDEIVFQVEAHPQSTSGSEAEWIIKQTYRIFKEGMLFCDLEMNLPAGSNSFNISFAKMGLTLGSQVTAGKLSWGYFTRDKWSLINLKSVSDKVEEKCMYPYVAIDYGVGIKSSYTNHVAFFVEDWKSLAGQKEMSGVRFAKSDKSEMIYNWILYEGNESSIKAPYTYRNRWGIGLGAMRKSSRSNISASRGNNLIGARYFHFGPGPQGYPEGESPDDWPWYLHPNFWSQPAKPYIYPSNEQIDHEAKLGTNVFVLHQSWMRNGGSNTWPPADYTPQNPDELKRVIDRCHEKGMRFGLYMRGTEAYSLYMPFFEQLLKYDFDGLYVDWNSPLYANVNNQGAFKPSETHFDAYAYFRYTKMLRKRVGENGFLIGHTGACPTIIALAVFDCYLPGEFIDQKEHLLDSPDMNICLGMKTYCGTQLISYTAPRDKAIAYSAGIGEGLQNEQGVLWQILKSVPMEKACFYDNLTENLQVVSSSNPAFYTTIYKISKDLLLAVTANTGDKGSSLLQLDTSSLGLVGQYTITEMLGSDYDSFRTRLFGTTDNGTINTGPLEKYEIRGYKFERVGSVAK